MILDFYRHIPENLNPVFFQIGLFQVRWYGIMYFVAFFVAFTLLLWRIKKGEVGQEMRKYFSLKNGDGQAGKLLDFFIYAVFGLLLGARLGFIFFYNFQYYFENPGEIFWPFKHSGEYMGIFGMSYHGGLLGIFLATVIFCRKNKIDFWQWADFVIPAIPAGFFFGRLGNFINGELYGRITESVWGMNFPSAPGNFLRYPSQLFEAFGEGLLLFLIFWFWRNKKIFSGWILTGYILGYGLVRFGVEFFRQPDEQIGLFCDWLSLGQIFSLAMIIGGIFLGAFLREKSRL